MFRVADRWVYDCSDGFRVPVTWIETHEVTAIDAQGIDVRVELRGDTMNYTRMERLLSPGVVGVGSVYDPAETRRFEPPLIRYQFPLTPGATWNQNLRNLDPQTSSTAPSTGSSASADGNRSRCQPARSTRSSCAS